MNQAKRRWTMGVLLVSLTCSAAAHAAATQDMQSLQIENEKLVEQLKKANEEIARLKGQTAAPAAGNNARDLREVNAPLTLTPEEQTQAPANSAAATSTVPLSTGSKDFTVAVGSKFWVNEWNTWRSPNISGGFTKGTNIQTLTSESNSELSGIPNLTLRYKSFFITGSYLAPTEYEFPNQSQVYSAIDNSGAVNLDYSLKGTREEWDVSLGYQIIPYMAVTAGYKKIDQTFSTSACQFGLVGSNSAPTNCLSALGSDPLAAKITYAGPTLGISGAAPIGNGFGLYGNFSYGWLGTNYNDSQGGDVGDVDYYVGELGFTYSHLMKEMPVYMPLSSATLYAGYRYQSYESELTGTSSQGGNNPKDVVQGFVSGLNLAF